MSRYSDWSREELIWKIEQLEREIEELKNENKEQYFEISSLRFKVDNELEPRIQAERRIYDNWVTNPER